MAFSLRDRSDLDRALRRVAHTRVIEIGPGAIRQTPGVFRDCFGPSAAVIVADPTTMRAAGEQVQAALGGAGIAMLDPFVFEDDDLEATDSHVARLQAALAPRAGTPVAVGSGTINDLVKLAAHRLGRPYLVAATAASMDGYTSWGAAILTDGVKQTIDCPAARAVVADTDVLAAAPPEMNAAGYADLLAKIVAGADWMLADALGMDPIDEPAWQMVHHGLRERLGDPAGVRAGKPGALAALVEGLMLSGLAIQATGTTRSASGSEHQFSHVWDMQHHRHQGKVPLHGLKVGVGVLCVASFYDELLAADVPRWNVKEIAGQWPEWESLTERIAERHDQKVLRESALAECRAKYLDRGALAARLTRLVEVWPELGKRLAEHLSSFATFRDMLGAAGAICDPSEIGIDRPRLRRTYYEALHMRRRFTVLDLAFQSGHFEPWLDRIFSPAGPWGA